MMNHITRKFVLAALFLVTAFGQICPAKASAGKDIDMVLKYYKAGQLKKAATYVKKIPKKASHSPIKSLSAKEKQAYKSTVKKYYNKYAKHSDSEWHIYLHGYYLADMDGDKRTELLVHHGMSPLESVLTVFKYQNGKAKKMAETYSSGFTEYYAYPGHNGILFRYGKNAQEEIGSLSLKKGRLKRKSYGQRAIGEYGYDEWFPLRQPLNKHIESNERGEHRISWKDLNVALTAKNTAAQSSSKKKVVKISHKYKMKKDVSERKVILYGKAKDGTVVWKFVSPYCICTETSNNDYFINKNVIYLFSTKLYAINKSTGKVKWTNDYETGSPSVAFDKKGNLYCTGPYDDKFICISSKGKLKFKVKYIKPHHWPYKIKIVSKKIRVYFENYDGKNYYFIYNEHGKYLGKHTVG